MVIVQRPQRWPRNDHITIGRNAGPQARGGAHFAHGLTSGQGHRVNKIDERWGCLQRIRMSWSWLAEEHLGAGVAIIEDVAAISGHQVGVGLGDIVEYLTGGDATVVE